MVSLFSVFDPVSVFGLSLNWLSLVLIMVFLPLVYYSVNGKLGVMYGWVVESVGVVIKEISYPSFLGLVCVGVVVFIMLGMMNAFGLFPFVFTGTSHVSVTFSLGLVFWFGFFLMGWVSSFEKSSAHLVPEGSPLVLGPLLVLIESVSHMIRPVTLSVRLAANMMAGHLIIGLISSLSVVSFCGGLVSVFLQILMLVLEWAVALIQAFVFSVLVVLYALEYY